MRLTDTYLADLHFARFLPAADGASDRSGPQSHPYPDAGMEEKSLFGNADPGFLQQSGQHFRVPATGTGLQQGFAILDETETMLDEAETRQSETLGPDSSGPRHLGVLEGACQQATWQFRRY